MQDMVFLSMCYKWLGNFRAAFGKYSILSQGNRMTSLTDANAVESDAGANAFKYDVNGNMTHDGRRFWISRGTSFTWPPVR